MALNSAVRAGVSDAGKNEASSELVVVKEALLRVVDLSLKHLASAGGAGSSTAGVRKIYASLLSAIKDVLVLWALDGLIEG